MLVPASQEAEPLDIEVTLHPRGQARSHTSYMLSSDALASPSSVTCDELTPQASSAGMSFGETNGRRRKAPLIAEAPGPPHRTALGEIRPSLAPRLRTRLMLSSRRTRLKQTGSANSGRSTSEGCSPKTSHGPRGSFPSVQSGIRLENPLSAEHTSQQTIGDGTKVHADSNGHNGSSFGGLGGTGENASNVFSSNSRCRSGDEVMGARQGQSESPLLVPSFVSTSGRAKGARGQVARRGGDCSRRVDCARRNPRSLLTTSMAFFEGFSDDGDRSDSSEDEDDGEKPPSHESYIKVACSARTSYKLFSNDPQAR